MFIFNSGDVFFGLEQQLAKMELRRIGGEFALHASMSTLGVGAV